MAVGCGLAARARDTVCSGGMGAPSPRPNSRIRPTSAVSRLATKSTTSAIRRSASIRATFVRFSTERTVSESTPICSTAPTATPTLKPISCSMHEGPAATAAAWSVIDGRRTLHERPPGHRSRHTSQIPPKSNYVEHSVEPPACLTETTSALQKRQGRRR